VPRQPGEDYAQSQSIAGRELHAAGIRLDRRLASDYGMSLYWRQVAVEDFPVVSSVANVSR